MAICEVKIASYNTTVNSPRTVTGAGRGRLLLCDNNELENHFRQQSVSMAQLVRAYDCYTCGIVRSQVRALLGTLFCHADVSATSPLSLTTPTLNFFDIFNLVHIPLSF